MKKKLVSALLVTTMAVSLLAGCGGDKASSAGTDGAGAEDTQDAGGGRCGRGRRRSRAGSSYHSRTRFRNKDGDVVFRRTAQHVLRTDAGKME